MAQPDKKVRASKRSLSMANLCSPIFWATGVLLFSSGASVWEETKCHLGEPGHTGKWLALQSLAAVLKSNVKEIA